MKHLFLAVLFVAGVLLAGSDGEWFPWANAAGLVLYLGAAVCSMRMMVPGRGE